MYRPTPDNSGTPAYRFAPLHRSSTPLPQLLTIVTYKRNGYKEMGEKPAKLLLAEAVGIEPM